MPRWEVEGGHLRPGNLAPWLREVLLRFDLPNQNIPQDTWLQPEVGPGSGYVCAEERDALLRWLLVDIWPRLHSKRPTGNEAEMPCDTLAVVVEAVDALFGSTRVQSKYGRCVALAALWMGVKWAEESEEQVEAGRLVRASRCAVSVQELARMERVLCRRLAWSLRPHPLLLLVQELLKTLLPSAQMAELLVQQVFPRLRAVLACSAVLHGHRLSQGGLPALALAVMAPVGVHLLTPEIELGPALLAVERARDAFDYAGVDDAFMLSTAALAPGAPAPGATDKIEMVKNEEGWTTVNRRKRRRIRSSKDSTSSLSAAGKDSTSTSHEERRPRVALGNVSNTVNSGEGEKTTARDGDYQKAVEQEEDYRKAMADEGSSVDVWKQPGAVC